LLCKKAAKGGFSLEAKNAGSQDIFGKPPKISLPPCRSEELVRRRFMKKEVSEHT